MLDRILFGDGSEFYMGTVLKGKNLYLGTVLKYKKSGDVFSY